MLRIQKYYFLSLVQNRNIVIFLLIFGVLFVSKGIDIGENKNDIFSFFILGLPSHNFLLISMLRFVLFYLLYLYFYSTSIANDISLVFIRLRNFAQWVQANFLFSLFFSIIYWGVYYLFVITMMGGIRWILFEKILLSLFFTILSSLILSILFVLFRILIKNETIVFCIMGLILFLYAYSPYLWGLGVLNSLILTQARHSSVWGGSLVILILYFVLVILLKRGFREEI